MDGGGSVRITGRTGGVCSRTFRRGAPTGYETSLVLAGAGRRCSFCLRTSLPPSTLPRPQTNNNDNTPTRPLASEVAAAAAEAATTAKAIPPPPAPSHNQHHQKQQLPAMSHLPRKHEVPLVPQQLRWCARLLSFPSCPPPPHARLVFGVGHVPEGRTYANHGWCKQREGGGKGRMRNTSTTRQNK